MILITFEISNRKFSQFTSVIYYSMEDIITVASRKDSKSVSDKLLK